MPHSKQFQYAAIKARNNAHKPNSLQLNGNLPATTKTMSTAAYHGGDKRVVYSVKDKPRVKNLFWIVEIFMCLMGAIPIPLEDWLPKNLHTFGRYAARFYCGFVIFTTFHLAVLYLKTTIDTFAVGKLESITDAITMTIIYFFATFASSYWLYFSNELKMLFKRINNEYRHHSLAGGSFVSTYSAYRLVLIFTTVWEIMCFSGVIFWGIAPLVTQTRILPLKCWYPFDALQPGVYSLLYAIQLLGQIYIGLIFSTTSALFVTSCITMLAQFDVLYCSLKNLDFHARLLAGEHISVLRKQQATEYLATDADELNQYLILQEYHTDLNVFVKLSSVAPSQTLNQQLHISLVECVRLHHFILECCDKLEQLYNPFCLVKSLQITVQLCMLVFVGVAGEMTIIRIVNQLQYLMLTVQELLLFTYFGELLSRHSVRVGEAFWRSQWFLHAHHIRKDVFIFLTNSRRMVKMTAGKFYIMDVDRLRSVITQAFSFLTLLQKLAAKKQE